MKVCLACGTRFESAEWSCTQCGWVPQGRADALVFAPELEGLNEGFEPEFFERLAAHEPDHFWFRARNKLIIWALATYFPTARTFFEVGCGTGYVLAGVRQALPQLTVAGSDVFQEGLAFARARLSDVSLFQMDARHVPFDQAFDVVGAFDVLEHIDDDERALAQLHQAVRPGGGLIITVPQHQFLWSVVDDYSHHQRRYGKRDLLSKVRRAGFVVERVTSFVSFLLPLAMVSRLVQHRGGRAIGSEFEISRSMNAVFERLMDAERLCITAGVTWPAGMSLMAVCRRPS